MLQTTSYNFTGTSTTEEVCVVVVKARKVHQKKTAQHAANVELLKLKYYSQFSPMLKQVILSQLSVFVLMGQLMMAPPMRKSSFGGQLATL